MRAIDAVASERNHASEDMRFTNKQLGLGTIAGVLVWCAPGCGSADEQKPAGAFSGAARGGTGGSGGTSGKGGRNGKGGSGASGGAGADTGDAGETATGGSSGGGSDETGGSGGDGETGGSGGKGNTGGTGTGGTGNTGTGGSAATGAYAGELIPGPDLDCRDVGDSPGSTLCDQGGDWSSGDTVLAEPGGADVLLSITPDELTVVWRYADALQPAYYTAERSSPGSDFGTAVRLDASAVDGAEGMALSPDGLRLGIALNTQFLELQRLSRSAPFVNAGSGNFALINVDAGEKSLRVGDPVIAADDLTLYYSVPDADQGYTLYVSRRQPGELWPLGVPLEECELQGHTTGLRRPTGVSADGLTLFYNDEPRGQQMAAFRSAIDEPFSLFVELGMLGGAQPNAACDRLYFSGPKDGLQVLGANAR